MSPGSRPMGRPSITSRPSAAMPRPTNNNNLPISHQKLSTTEDTEEWWRVLPSNEIDPRKKVPNLERRRVGRIRSVRGIALDRLRELLPNRARIGLGRVSGAHQRAPLSDRVRRFEDHHERRA